VIRKGCTPARPGQEGFVGASMGDDSVILEGVESAEAQESLFSTVHGAGRVMSRTQAAGKVRRRKRWACTVRDCRRVFDTGGSHAPGAGGPPVACPEHPGARLRKVWIEEQIKPGVVDWPAVQARLRERGTPRTDRGPPRRGPPSAGQAGAVSVSAASRAAVSVGTCAAVKASGGRSLRMLA